MQMRSVGGRTQFWIGTSFTHTVDTCRHNGYAEGERYLTNTGQTINMGELLYKSIVAFRNVTMLREVCATNKTSTCLDVVRTTSNTAKHRMTWALYVPHQTYLRNHRQSQPFHGVIFRATGS